jgi:hypothetical protein
VNIVHILKQAIQVFKFKIIYTISTWQIRSRIKYYVGIGSYIIFSHSFKTHRMHRQQTEEEDPRNISAEHQHQDTIVFTLTLVQRTERALHQSHRRCTKRPPPAAPFYKHLHAHGSIHGRALSCRENRPCKQLAPTCMHPMRTRLLLSMIQLLNHFH